MATFWLIICFRDFTKKKHSHVYNSTRVQGRLNMHAEVDMNGAGYNYTPAARTRRGAGPPQGWAARWPLGPMPRWGWSDRQSSLTPGGTAGRGRCSKFSVTFYLPSSSIINIKVVWFTETKQHATGNSAKNQFSGGSFSTRNNSTICFP